MPPTEDFISFSIENQSLKTVLLLISQQENMTRQHPSLPGGGRFREDFPYQYTPGED
jgi:hypothetical protein